LTKLKWNILPCYHVTNNTIKADVGSSLQIFFEIALEKKSERVGTTANVPAVENTIANFRNVALTGKNLLCGYRPS
jgi:hypothetical protein